MSWNALSGAGQGWLVIAGWSVIVVLWHSSIVALAFAAWRSLNANASPRRHHAAALVALAMALALAAATPTLLARAASRPQVRAAAAPAVGGASVASAVVAPVVRLATTASVVASTAGVRAAVWWLGAVWVVGCVVLVARLLWGMAAVRWIRARARPATSPRVAAAVTATCEAWQLPPPPVLSSALVDGPVALGVRQPCVVVPHGVEERLPPDALAHLIAHELAHVARRDYAVNLGQSLADAVLFFSPGAVWLSRVAREAREFCCDDLAVERCGGPGPYAHALMLLAGSGVPRQARLALGASGPRLVVRIRRLLKEESMVRHPRRHAAVVVASLVLALAGGRSLVSAAIAGVPALDFAPPFTQSAPRLPEAPAQPGAPAVELAVPIPYPDEALAAAVQGPVVLAVTVDPNGQPVSVTAVSGDPLLTPSAVDAVGRWRFAASGQPQAFLLGVNVVPRESALSMMPSPPIRVGGQVKPPTRVVNVNPAYPPDARAAGVQGVVIMEVRIGADGIVDSAVLLKSVPGLDVAALTSALQWQYTPTRLNGAGVPVMMTVTVNFTLM